MDYVIAGFGIGAVLALIGFALWELFGAAEKPGRAWLARAAIGLMLGALVIWAITGVSLLSTIDDSTGSHLVWLTTLVTLVAIAVVSLWYRHAEQAQLIATQPEARRPGAPETGTATSALAVSEEIELSEWDTWPERDAPTNQPDRVETETASAADFEPEMAAEPAPMLVESESAAQLGEQPGEPASPIASADAVDLLVADQVAPPDETVDAGAPTGAPLDRAEETESIPERLPENVLAFRPKEPAEPASIEPDVEPLPSNPLAAEQGTAPLAPPPEREADKTNAPPEAEAPDPGPAIAPVAFESSVLADLDITSIEEGDGRYRSPLLADLESNASELEEIGLAKWRPEDRLTADTVEEPPKRRKKR